MKSMTFFIALLAIALIVGCGGSGGSSTTANIAPSVSINANPTTGNAPLSVTFTATATDTDGTIASYYWSFGDSETSTMQNPNHTYQNAGTFTASVRATDNSGGSATAQVQITVITASTGGTGGTGGTGDTGGGGTTNTSPTASISSDVTNGTAPLSVQFTATASDSDGTISSYSWDFGDNTSSTQANPNHTYDTAGTYIAILTVTDDDNATDTAQLNITVTAPSDSGIATLPFSEDFSGDLSKWTTWGDPLPEIDSMTGNPSQSLNPNGDGNFDSGIVSNDAFDFSNGLVLEADLIHPVTESLWTWVGFGLSSTSSIDSWGGYDIGVGVHIEPPNVTYVVTGDSGFSRPSDTNWHSYKVVIRSDLKVEFYRDNILEYTSINSLTLAIGKPFVIAGRDIYGSVRADNVRISPDTTLFNDDFSGDLSKWVSWGYPLPEVDSFFQLNPNGDGNFDSGIVSNDAFDFSNGLVLEADLIHPVTESLWTWVGFGMAKTDTEESWGGYDIGVGVHIEPPNISYVSMGDTGFTKASDLDWHSYKIVIRPDLKVEFYCDNVLEYTTTNPLTLTTDKPLMIAGRDIYGNVRADNIKISPYTYLFAEDFSEDLAKWILWGDPLPEIDSFSGNILPSLNLNGDSMYDSGAITPTPYDFSAGGYSISADMLVPAGWSQGWTFTGLALTTDIPESYGATSGFADTGCLAYIQLNDNNNPNSFYRVPGLSPSEGYSPSWEDPLDTSWHTFTIRITSDRKIEFYRDDVLKATTTGALTISQLSQVYVVIAGRDEFSDVRIDNVKITK